MKLEFSNKENKERIEFINNHKECHKLNPFNIKYICQETGIGTTITIRCIVCHESKNITDCESW
jgi:hypothetical protein